MEWSSGVVSDEEDNLGMGMAKFIFNELFHAYVKHHHRNDGSGGGWVLNTFQSDMLMNPMMGA